MEEKLQNNNTTEIKQNTISETEQKIIDSYLVHKSIRRAALDNNCGHQRVMKVLSTYGIYVSDVQQEIIELFEQGYDKGEIAEKVGRSIKTVESYSPAKRPFYFEDPSNNSLVTKKVRIRKEVKKWFNETLVEKIVDELYDSHKPIKYDTIGEKVAQIVEEMYKDKEI